MINNKNQHLNYTLNWLKGISNNKSSDNVIINASSDIPLVKPLAQQGEESGVVRHFDNRSSCRSGAYVTSPEPGFLSSAPCALRGRVCS